jgi:hypothetical protein
MKPKKPSKGNIDHAIRWLLDIADPNNVGDFRAFNTLIALAVHDQYEYESLLRRLLLKRGRP